MKITDILLRCMAQQRGEQWQALCLDLCLAAQGDTFEEAKGKLEGMIEEYLEDALIGEDQAYAHQLLNRKAPASDWMRYYFWRFLAQFGRLHSDVRKLFTEALPLRPHLHHV